MTCVTDLTQHAPLLKTSILAKDLSTLLNECDTSIKILSLDCFDTLLWRKTSTPHGVFFNLQHQPTFKAIGLDPYSRMNAEKNARVKKRFNQSTNEVSLIDIYKAFDKTLSETTLHQLATEELLCEMDACFSFPTAIELIHQAYKNGMKIIVVSDTYFNEDALRKLLAHCLSKNTYNMISNVFCSSDYNRSKKNGLFYDVMKKINYSEKEIWHVGDNYFSDFIGAQQHQIRATHLIAHNKTEANTLFRLRAFASGFIDSRIGHERPQYDPFLGVTALTDVPLSEPEYLIGYLSLGPILYAFSEFVKDEINHLKSQGKNPKVLFLLRDGYLPFLSFNELMGEKVAHAVYLSRFCAIAASFSNQDDIDEYIYKFLDPQNFLTITKQLLIPEENANYIIQHALQSPNPTSAFVELIHEPNCLVQIYNNSNQFRKRLYRYLENETGLTDNDTIIFVDLGYTGTAHIKLSPIFKQERNIDVISRYLIACYVNDADSTRRGLIDSSWCDPRAYSAIITFISLFEKLCSIGGNSVVNYDEQGNPLFSDSKTKNKNIEKTKLIQQKVVEFIHDAKQFIKNASVHFDNKLLRDTAIAELCRLLFFPTQLEISYLKTLEYELDMGSSQVLPVFDEEKGLEGLKRRGLFFMEKNRGTMRTNFPAELRFAGIEMSTMLLMQERLKFDLRIPDMSLRRETIPIIIMYNGEGANSVIEALPTYDGYYSLSVPINFGEYQVGIQFGLQYRWVQIDAIEMIPSQALYKSHESDYIKKVESNLYFESMKQQDQDLYECQTKAASLIYLGDMNLQSEKQVLHIIFRPICRVQ